MRNRARKLISALVVMGTLGLAAPAAAFAAFGAIAVGPSSYGRSWNYSTKAKAERKAKTECLKYGPNCKVILWVGGTRCAATYYNNTSHSKVYYAFASSEAKAESKVVSRHPGAIFITAVCATHS